MALLANVDAAVQLAHTVPACHNILEDVLDQARSAVGSSPEDVEAMEDVQLTLLRIALADLRCKEGVEKLRAAAVWTRQGKRLGGDNALFAVSLACACENTVDRFIFEALRDGEVLLSPGVDYMEALHSALLALQASAGNSNLDLWQRFGERTTELQQRWVQLAVKDLTTAMPLQQMEGVQRCIRTLDAAAQLGQGFRAELVRCLPERHSRNVELFVALFRADYPAQDGAAGGDWADIVYEALVAVHSGNCTTPVDRRTIVEAWRGLCIQSLQAFTAAQMQSQTQTEAWTQSVAAEACRRSAQAHAIRTDLDKALFEALPPEALLCLVDPAESDPNTASETSPADPNVNINTETDAGGGRLKAFAAQHLALLLQQPGSPKGVLLRALLEGRPELAKRCADTRETAAAPTIAEMVQQLSTSDLLDLFRAQPRVSGSPCTCPAAVRDMVREALRPKLKGLPGCRAVMSKSMVKMAKTKTNTDANVNAGAPEELDLELATLPSLEDWSLQLSCPYPGCQNTQAALLDAENALTGAGVNYGHQEFIQASFEEPVAVHSLEVAACNFGGWGSSYISHREVKASLDLETWQVVGNTGAVPFRGTKLVELQCAEQFRHFRIVSSNTYLATAALRLYGYRDMTEAEQLDLATAALRSAIGPRGTGTQISAQELQLVLAEAEVVGVCSVHPGLLVGQRHLKSLEQQQQPLHWWTLRVASPYPGLNNDIAALLDGTGTTGVGVLNNGHQSGSITACFPKLVEVHVLEISSYKHEGWGGLYLQATEVQGSFDGEQWFSICTLHNEGQVWLPEPQVFRYFRLIPGTHAMMALDSLRFRGRIADPDESAGILSQQVQALMARCSSVEELLMLRGVPKMLSMSKTSRSQDAETERLFAAQLQEFERVPLHPRDGWALTQSSNYPGMQNSQAALLDEDSNLTGVGTHAAHPEPGEWIAASFTEPVAVKMITVAAYVLGGWGATYLNGTTVEGSMNERNWFKVAEVNGVPEKGKRRLWLAEPLAFRHWRLCKPPQRQLATAAFRLFGPGEKAAEEKALHASLTLCLQGAVQQAAAQSGREPELQGLRAAIAEARAAGLEVAEAEAKAANVQEALREEQKEVRKMMTGAWLCTVSCSARTTLQEVQRQVQEATGIPAAQQSIVAGTCKLRRGSAAVDPRREVGGTLFLVQTVDEVAQQMAKDRLMQQAMTLQWNSSGGRMGKLQRAAELLRAARAIDQGWSAQLAGMVFPPGTTDHFLLEWLFESKELLSDPALTLTGAVLEAARSCRRGGSEPEIPPGLCQELEHLLRSAPPQLEGAREYLRAFCLATELSTAADLTRLLAIQPHTQRPELAIARAAQRGLVNLSLDLGQHDDNDTSHDSNDTETWATLLYSVLLAEGQGDGAGEANDGPIADAWTRLATQRLEREPEAQEAAALACRCSAQGRAVGLALDEQLLEALSSEAMIYLLDPADPTAAMPEAQPLRDAAEEAVLRMAESSISGTARAKAVQTLGLLRMREDLVDGCGVWRGGGDRTADLEAATTAAAQSLPSWSTQDLLELVGSRCRSLQPLREHLLEALRPRLKGIHNCKMVLFDGTVERSGRLDTAERDAVEALQSARLDNWVLRLSSPYPGCANNKSVLLQPGDQMSGAGVDHAAQAYIMASFSEPVVACGLEVGACHFGGWGSCYISGVRIEGSDDLVNWRLLGNTGTVPHQGSKTIWLQTPGSYRNYRLIADNYLATSALCFYGEAKLSDAQQQALATKALELAGRSNQDIIQTLQVILAEAEVVGVDANCLEDGWQRLELVRRLLRTPLDSWSLRLASPYPELANSKAALLDGTRDTGTGNMDGILEVLFPEPVEVHFFTITAYTLGGWGGTYLEGVRVEGSEPDQFPRQIAPVLHDGEGPQHIWLDRPTRLKSFRLIGGMYFALEGLRFHGVAS